MEQKNKTGQFIKITEEMAAIYDKKNKVYGDSFSEAIRTYGQFWRISASTQITHKYNRLISLVKNSTVDNLGESLEDTLLDLANYSIMFIMELRESTRYNSNRDQEGKVNAALSAIEAMEKESKNGHIIEL